MPSLLNMHNASVDHYVNVNSDTGHITDSNIITRIAYKDAF